MRFTSRIRPPFGRTAWTLPLRRAISRRTQPSPEPAPGEARWLSWKLKHCCRLTFRQVRQKLNVPIREFQRIVVYARHVFIDLAKDGRGVLDCFYSTAKQADSRALWLLIEGEFSARGNTTAVRASSGAANPRVPVLKLRVTSRSPTLAGRNLAACNQCWDRFPRP
jgi:hypothetical protein